MEFTNGKTVIAMRESGGIHCDMDRDKIPLQTEIALSESIFTAYQKAMASIDGPMETCLVVSLKRGKRMDMEFGRSLGQTAKQTFIRASTLMIRSTVRGSFTGLRVVTTSAVMNVILNTDLE
jgi:hypothetical protein